MPETRGCCGRGRGANQQQSTVGPVPHREPVWSDQLFQNLARIARLRLVANLHGRLHEIAAIQNVEPLLPELLQRLRECQAAE